MTYCPYRICFFYFTFFSTFNWNGKYNSHDIVNTTNYDRCQYIILLLMFIYNYFCRKEYLDMYINYIFNESIEKQFTAFNDGFLKVCDSKVLVSWSHLQVTTPHDILHFVDNFCIELFSSTVCFFFFLLINISHENMKIKNLWHY